MGRPKGDLSFYNKKFLLQPYGNNKKSKNKKEKVEI